MIEKEIEQTEQVTKSAHYETETGFDAVDLMYSSGDMEGFCAGNATKYIARRHKKGTPTEDVVKAFDYLVMLMHLYKIPKERALRIIEKRYLRNLR